MIKVIRVVAFYVIYREVIVSIHYKKRINIIDVSRDIVSKNLTKSIRIFDNLQVVIMIILSKGISVIMIIL